MQKHVNLVDLVKSFSTIIYLQKSASIQPRKSLSKFGGKFNLLFIRLLRPDAGFWDPNEYVYPGNWNDYPSNWDTTRITQSMGYEYSPYPTYDDGKGYADVNNDKNWVADVIAHPESYGAVVQEVED